MVEDHDDLDLLNAFWLASEKHKHLSCYKGLIRRARPYVFDDDATELITELGSGDTIGDKLAIYRRLARLPFDVVWFEIPYKTRFRKRVELGVNMPWGDPQYNDTLPPDAPSKMGWLLERLTPTSWRVTVVASFDPERTESGRSVDTFAITSVVSTEGPVTFYPRVTDPIIKQTVLTLNKEVPIIAYRMWGFATLDDQGRTVDGMPTHLTKSNAFDLAPSWETIINAEAGPSERKKREEVAKHLSYAANELAGDLRFVVTALATINEVPTVFETVQRTGSVRVAGGMKPYMVNRIVRIGIPKARGRVRKILAMLRLAERAMRRHEVSGHWKNVRTKGGKELRWVEDYMRGDAELGFVRQIREVEGQ